MQFFYDGARLPPDQRLLLRVDAAAARLRAKLLKLGDVRHLPISDYNRRYLGGYLKCLDQTLARYAYLVTWAVADAGVPLEELAFVDYGAGSGVMTLLAKELGIGIVVFNDIYGISCRDARVIGEAVNCAADHYVEGGVAELVTYVKARSIECRAVASFDVIEHVYDVDELLRGLADLTDGPLTAVLASGANPRNLRTVRSLMQKQREIEHTDREKKPGDKDRDCCRAFRGVRREIVARRAPTLSVAQLDELARATRGLRGGDIERAVDAFLLTGRMPSPPEHPTNTCDPYTGNWAEHLLDLDHLRAVLEAAAFRVEFLPGYYWPENAAKKVLAAVVNRVMSLLRERSLAWAPYYALYARRARAPRRL